MRASDDFTVEYWPDRPWARVWHPQGFSEPGCEAFLTFWAWQDQPPRRVRRDAQWTSATWMDWHEWATTLACTGITPRQLARRVDTLYRYYTFWHWYDPQCVPRQFWPSDRRERQRWIQQFWDEAP